MYDDLSSSECKQERGFPRGNHVKNVLDNSGLAGSTILFHGAAIRRPVGKGVGLSSSI